MNKTSKLNVDQPIPFTVVDPDAPIPYRIRVATPSVELRNFVVPVLGIQGEMSPPGAIPEERPSEVRLKKATRAA
jgi:hypothetical protein